MILKNLITKGLSVVMLASVVSAVSVNYAVANSLVGGDNPAANTGTVSQSLFVATQLNSSAVAHAASAVDSGHTSARSVSLYYKDTSSGTAQTATVLAGGALSLYAQIATTVAISATGGTMGSNAANNTVTMAATSGSTGVAFTVAAGISATPIALIWTAPSTTGSYTLSMTRQNSSLASLPTSTNPLAGAASATIVVEVVSSHPAVGSDNIAATGGTANSSLFVATKDGSGTPVLASVADVISGTSVSSGARSRGVLYKDTSKSTAQTATILSGGSLSLYAAVTTSVAFSSSGGTFSSTAQGNANASVVSYNASNTNSLVVLTAAQSALGSTSVATIWTAPTTIGTYTLSMYVHSGSVAPTVSSPSDGTLAARITVSVVAASAGGAVSVANSTCVTDNESGALASTADDTQVVTNGNAWYIKYILRDAYLSALASSGNLVATATNGALLSIGNGSQTAGTSSTVVAYGNGAASSDYDAIRVDQPTAGAPLTTTVTLTFDGVTVCTKTVTIRGEAASMVVKSVASGDIGTGSTNGVGSAVWIGDATNRAGHYTVTLLDSAGNIATPSANTEFSADAASLTTTVTALAVASGSIATSTSSSSAWSNSVGTFTCGPTAGSSKVKLKHTATATGKIITAEFTPRCADDAYTYTASFDKASYNQGEIATLTLKFLDSKGNPANSTVAVGTSQIILPMMTFVSATGTASSLTDANGEIKYTLTVGTTSGMTAGTYSGVVDFTALTAVAATKQTPTYTLKTGGDTTTNADVLKSIVALIASINKQIQALQKLILQRR